MAEVELGDGVDARVRAPVDALGRGVAVAALVAVAGYALVALGAADDSLANRTYRFGLADGMPWRMRLGSLLVAVGVYLLADGGTSWRRVEPGARRDVLRFAAVWLVGVAVGTLATGVGAATWDGPVRTIRGVLVVPLIEELVFRGALFALATKVAADRWEGRATWLFPIVSTGVLFWLGHLQYSFFDAPDWVEERGYTILGGLAFGWLRHRTGSVLAPLAVHSVGNAVALLAGSI